MAKIKTKNLQIGYEKRGNGPPVILISGLGYGRWLWEKQLQGLEPYFSLYALDNRGLGESDAPLPPYSISDMARDVKDFMQAMEIEKANIVGTSLGGFIAQVFALEYPKMTEKLVLVSTTGGGGGGTYASSGTLFRLKLAGMKKDPEKRARARLRITLSPEFWQKNPEEGERLLQKFLHQTATSHGIKAQMEAGQNYWKRDHRWTSLHRVRATTLIISGNKDRIVPPVNSKKLAGEIPRARLEFIENTGHLVMWEKPEQFNDLLYSFCKPD